MTASSAFWADLAEDLKDPEFLRAYVLESIRTKTVDTIVNVLDAAREDAQMNKANLARAIAAEPASVRRLLSSTSSNPTLGTVSELAAALGYRLTLEPLPGHLGSALSTALATGKIEDQDCLQAAIAEFDLV